MCGATAAHFGAQRTGFSKSTTKTNESIPHFDVSAQYFKNKKARSFISSIYDLWFPIRIDMRAASVWLCDLTSFIICETISAEFSIEWVVIRSIAFIHITHIHSFKVPLNRKRFAIEAVNMSNEMSLKLQTTNRKWFKHTHSHTNIYKYRISHMRLIKVKFTNFISRCNAFIG